METNKEFWREFLEIYRSLPALWRVKSSEYSNRSIKAACYEQLVDKLREVYPDADREMAVKKLNNFRTNYRREKKKICANMIPPCSAVDSKLFVSSLWYYNLLTFLDNDMMESDDSFSIKQSLESDNCDGSESEVPVFQVRKPQRKRKKIVSDSFKPIKIPDQPVKVAPIRTNIINSIEINKREFSNNDISTAQRVTSSTLSTAHHNTSANNNTANQNAIIIAQANYWANQFIEMPDNQKLIARKLISDVLYYGCIGKLEESNVDQMHKLFNDPLHFDGI